MRKDYWFLIGQRFSFRGEIYVVRDLAAAEDRSYVVHANPSPDDMPAQEEAAREGSGWETFSLAEVIQSLVVDEEIELFNPNFLGAR